MKERLGIDFHQTTADGRYTLEPVYCLGNCACGPSLLLDQELHGQVTPAAFDKLAATGPKPAPVPKCSTYRSGSVVGRRNQPVP